MGGSALHVPTRRLLRTDFEEVSARLQASLSQALGGGRVAVVPAYRSKADFGDLDLLVDQAAVASHGGRNALQAWASSVCHAREIVDNGPVMSLDYRSSPSLEVGFQVDLILAPEDEFEFSLAYFSFNDLGNLIGRTAHKMGFKYGHNGLIYPFREGTRMYGDVLVSRDLDKSLTFLGYAPARFHQGFNDLAEIFDYVTQSTYFNPSIFLLENRNHASRTRDRKRKTYRAFLEWIADRGDLPAYAWADRDDEPARSAEKQHFLSLALRHFPTFNERLGEMKRQRDVSATVRSRFNGDAVAQWTGLSGKPLSQFMAQLRAQHDGLDGLYAWLTTHDDNALETWVKEQLRLATVPARSVSPRC